MKYCCAFVRQILTSRLFPGQRLNDCGAGAVWCNKCRCSCSGPWGHAFLPMYSTCLFNVSLLCLGLFQFLCLSSLLSSLCECVCVWGGSPTGRELGCFQGKRNLSCLLRKGSFPPLCPSPAFWQSGCRAGALLSLMECRAWRRHCPSSPAANLSCPWQGRCCVQRCTR